MGKSAAAAKQSGSSESASEESETTGQEGRRYKLLGGGGRDLLAEAAAQSQSVLEGELIRLQALLAQWLRMDNVVVLMSAGCSYSQGGKLMGTLEKAVLELLAKKYRASKQSSVSALIEERRRAKEPCTFEDWLSYLSNAYYLTTEPASPITGCNWKGDVAVSAAELKSLHVDLRNAIYAYCMLELPEPFEKASGHHA